MPHTALTAQSLAIISDLFILRLSKVAGEASKKPIRPEVRNLVLEICCTCTGSNDEDAEVPYIKYNFR